MHSRRRSPIISRSHQPASKSSAQSWRVLESSYLSEPRACLSPRLPQEPAVSSLSREQRALQEMPALTNSSQQQMALSLPRERDRTAATPFKGMLTARKARPRDALHSLRDSLSFKIKRMLQQTRTSQFVCSRLS